MSPTLRDEMEFDALPHQAQVSAIKVVAARLAALAQKGWSFHTYDDRVEYLVEETNLHAPLQSPVCR